MHVALIIDEERLAREHGMLHRLLAGLTERGFRLTGVLPEPPPGDEVPDDLEIIVAAACVHTRMKVPPWMRRVRAAQVASDLDPSPPDLIHSIGENAWALGLDLARAIDRPVTLDVWSADLVRRTPPARGGGRVAGYVCPTEPIAEALRQRVPSDLVSLVPVGVELPETPRRVLEDPAASIALAIIGSGHDVAAHKAMLTGLSRLVQEFPQIQMCIELRGPQEHEIWRHARRLDLLGHISGIVDAARHRQLLTGCDILVVPERSGQVRSLVFQAMALGMPVIASEDPSLDMLIDDRTAIIVREADPEEWADQIRRLVTTPELAARLGESARAWVAARNRAEDQVSRLASAFEQVISGGAHTFSGADL